MWKYNFKCAQFCFWKKIGTAMASTLKSIQKQSNIITHVEQWQKSNKLMWHWRLMWDECNSETQLPYSDFKAQIILHDSWPSRHAIECQPTCQLIIMSANALANISIECPTTCQPTVNWYGDQESINILANSAEPYSSEGCTNYARSPICTNSKCKSGTKCTSPEFWVPVAQIMDQPVCPCKW